jgi:pimeloyl-ACP methyl ester carboxylesterase
MQRPCRRALSIPPARKGSDAEVKALLAIVRWIWNLALAAALVVAVCAILLWGYAAVNVNISERLALEAGVEEGTWLSIDEQPIYYREWGQPDAPTVVLVHGYAVEGSLAWMANGPALAEEGLRVIAVDLRGFGRSARDLAPNYSLRSQATTLAKLLNELYVREATVVGHGWGAAVALQLAAEQPQFVERLALIAPILQEGVSPLWRQVVRLPYLGRGAVWAVSTGGPMWRANQMDSFADPSAIPGDYWERVLPTTRVEDTAEALRMMALSPADSDLPGALATIPMPVLVLVGEADKRVPPQAAQKIADQLPDAQLRVIAGAGHALQIEQAGQVNARIADFALRGVR